MREMLTAGARERCRTSGRNWDRMRAAYRCIKGLLTQDCAPPNARRNDEGSRRLTVA